MNEATKKTLSQLKELTDNEKHDARQKFAKSERCDRDISRIETYDHEDGCRIRGTIQDRCHHIDQSAHFG